MRLLVLATLLAATLAVVLVPQASAGTCDPIDFSVYIDQTGGLACRTADWALVGGPSPIGLTVGYVSCYVFGQPPAYWVPNCS